MNRLLLTMILFICFLIPQAWGASQYPNPYRQTMWNNFTDSIHTIGQNPRQAALTKSRLHNLRLQARIYSIKQARIKAWMQDQNQQQ